MSLRINGRAVFSGKTTIVQGGESAPAPNLPITRAELVTMIKAGEDVTEVNTSEITDFSELFYLDELVGDVTGWDVSSATTFSLMFSLGPFNQDISGWDVSNCKNFSNMFATSTFNQDISGWNVSSGTDFTAMFSQCPAFNKDISQWDVSKGTYFQSMFAGASLFNKDLSSWDVGSGVYFGEMFARSRFNHDISGWNVDTASFWPRFRDDCPLTDANTPFKFGGSAPIPVPEGDPVTQLDLYLMIANGKDVTKVNTSEITDFAGLFTDNTTFNQNIGGWDVSKGLWFYELFKGASSFDQDISGWNVDAATDWTRFRNNCPLADEHTPPKFL